MSAPFETLVLTIGPESAGLRIDKALTHVTEIPTRSQALKLLLAGRVRIAGRVVKPSYLTVLNDLIHIELPIEQQLSLEPYDFPLVIPYEDADLLVVDKPAGLVVHPAYGHAKDTLVNALLNHTRDLALGFNELRPGLVHRIDKDTSGLLVIAKNEMAQRLLSLQFQNKSTHRIYRAAVFGKLMPENGTIQSYIRRHPVDRKRMASAPSVAGGLEAPLTGKLAVTHYKTLQVHQSGISLVELKLETGRTHQIRVHLSEKSHPIVGDVVYGGSTRIKSLKSVHLRKLILSLPRFVLHAAELGFLHPQTGKRMLFKSPWPADLKPLVEHCDFPLFNETYEISE